MKARWFLVVLALLAVFPAYGGQYDLYILAGQSNMDGRGSVDGLDGALALPQNDAMIYYANPLDPSRDGESTVRSGWQTLAPGYSIAPGTSRDEALPNGTFGPELSFAHAMTQANPDGNPIAIIKVTRGGTNLRSDWSPTGFMYRALVDEIDTALKALADDGHTATVRGLLWHQGESDSNRLDEYQGEFETLIANVRNKVDAPDLPVVIGELASTKSEAFRLLQKKIADDNKAVGFASSAGLETTDKTHFSAQAQVVLGQRYAQAIDALSPVPEPSSLTVLGLGGLVLLRRRRSAVR